MTDMLGRRLGKSAPVAQQHSRRLPWVDCWRHLPGTGSRNSSWKLKSSVSSIWNFSSNVHAPMTLLAALLWSRRRGAVMGRGRESSEV